MARNVAPPREAITIHTTDRAFHALWAIVQGARANSATVKVPKEALTALLQDHSELIGPYEKRGTVTYRP